MTVLRACVRVGLFPCECIYASVCVCVGAQVLDLEGAGTGSTSRPRGTSHCLRVSVFMRVCV